MPVWEVTTGTTGLVTDHQVMVLRQKLMEGKGQQAAAAASGILRTARTWPAACHQGRRASTGEAGPFAEIWEEVEPLLRSDVEGLKATTILEWLDERHPGRFSVSQLRTRASSSRLGALSGPDGRCTSSRLIPLVARRRWTSPLRRVGCDGQRRAVRSLLFHFVSHSGWRTWTLPTGSW